MTWHNDQYVYEDEDAIKNYKKGIMSALNNSESNNLLKTGLSLDRMYYNLHVMYCRNYVVWETVNSVKTARTNIAKFMDEKIEKDDVLKKHKFHKLVKPYIININNDRGTDSQILINKYLTNVEFLQFELGRMYKDVCIDTIGSNFNEIDKNLKQLKKIFYKHPTSLEKITCKYIRKDILTPFEDDLEKKFVRK